MVELIMVIILTGILAAVAATRFYTRTGFDVSTFAEQMRAMVRYAQKLAIAQNRNVWVTGSLTGGVALCYANALPCPTAQQVPVPGGGTNSGNSNTRYFCAVGGKYAPTWYCESVPSAGISMSPSGNGTFSPFYFSGLGKPYLPNDMPSNGGPSQESSFTTTTYTFAGDNVSIPITISQETGYVN